MSRSNKKRRGCGCGCLVAVVVLGLLAGLMRDGGIPNARQPNVSNDTAPTAVLSHAIPGLAAVDVHGNLTNKGFKLSTLFGPEQAEWKCVQETNSYSMTVEVFGQSPTRITSIRAVYLNLLDEDTNQRAAEFLSFVASVPYEGASPAEAKSWVTDNIGVGATRTFAGVTFELIARPDSPRTRMLLIGPAAK